MPETITAKGRPDKFSTEEKERSLFILERADTMQTAKDDYSRSWEEYEKVYWMEETPDGI